MTELSLDETLSRVRGHIIKLFNGHEWLDDLLQEAAISAWKDHQAGMPMSRIIMRAKFRVLGLISEKSTQYEKWTGRLPGARNHEYEEKEGAEHREKLREFISSYTGLHGHKPSVPEMAKHMDMTRQSIYRHLDRLWLFSGNREFKLLSMDSFARFWDGTTGEERASDVVRFGFEFEDRLINNLDTFNWLKNQTDERERTFIYCKVFKQMTAKEIGALYGIHKSTVEQVVYRAFKRMREELSDKAIR